MTSSGTEERAPNHVDFEGWEFGYDRGDLVITSPALPVGSPGLNLHQRIRLSAPQLEDVIRMYEANR